MVYSGNNDYIHLWAETPQHEKKTTANVCGFKGNMYYQYFVLPYRAMPDFFRVVICLSGSYIFNDCVLRIALLSPSEPVRIIKQPSSISALEGSCISLKCMAKGFPKPTYQWFKDEDDELDTGVDKELMFKDLSLEDVGEYYCKVSNDVSSECTEVVTIDVVPQGMFNMLLEGRLICI